MRIAVNTRLLLKNKLEGIGWFTYETLKRITQQHPEHEFIFIFDRKYDSDFIFSSNITPVVIMPQSRHPLLWYIYFEYSIPYILKKYKADIFLSPDGWISLNTNVKTLTVIHDINFEHFPHFFSPLVRKYLLYYFHRFAAKADRIATVSEYTKIDIMNVYGINSEKIDVVYNGANSSYKALNDIEKQEVRRKYTNGEDFFIFIGAFNPRKNLPNLFRAFDKYKEKTNKGTKLVLVGDKKYWSGENVEVYNGMKHKDDVIFTGRLAPEKLNSLLSSSLALCYVSLFEGFGIPIIEAFHAETAVITANVSSMPEIAGDAAYYASPDNPDEIADAMKEIAENTALRERLIEKGRTQRQLFSWDKTASSLWKSIEKLF
jgi:glycosyltransferase involved in cell wall biosynthesis